MKKVIYLSIFITIFACQNQNKTLSDYPITPVKISKVELKDNFWLPKIETIQNTTIQYALSKCETEGRMENFLIAGGQMEGETRGKMPFDDTDLYKIIEGASLSLISHPDKELESYIDSLIAIIAIGQEDDGYLTTWKIINPEKSPAWWAPPGDRWENLSTSHELYNSGHLFEAAAAHYDATGKTNFLDIATKNADLLVATFGTDKNPNIPGHQIVETGLIKLYHITKNKSYLELAKHFLDERGNSENRELYGEYNQDHKPVTEQDEVVGHAVRAVYMYAGMTDIAALYGDTAYLHAVNALWDNMINKKLYLTGGIGARHEGESFGKNYELPNLTAYNETCAAIGSIYWNHRMFLLTGESKYYDVIERTLYNGMIAGISLDGNKFFYPNPLEADGEYKFNQGACTRQEWFECSCCPTNIIRFVPSVPELIYALEGNIIFINLFMANEANMKVNKTNVQIIQNTDYPRNGKINIVVNPDSQKEFILKLRIPGWIRNQVTPGTLYQYVGKNTGEIVLKINGEELPVNINEGYIDISRKWSKGDEIELILPMEIRYVVSNEKVVDDTNLVALEYGPFVYCAEEVDNSNFGNLHLNQDMNLKVESRDDLLGGINLIRGDDPSDSESMVFVPYFSWSNRGIGKMKVWFPQEIQ
jgi:uncharacterized protein